MVNDKMVNIYIFDLGGVLINLNVERCISRFRELMDDEYIQSVLGLGEDGEGIIAVSAATKQLMADFERGNISAEDFVTEVQRYCHEGTTRQQIIDAWLSMLADLPQERLEFVRRMKEQGKRVYLLSNGNDLHFGIINKTFHLDTYFERMFLSQELHLAKPENAIYEYVEKTINPSHKPAIFIDDLEKNRLAAQQTVGWETYESITQMVKERKMPPYQN